MINAKSILIALSAIAMACGAVKQNRTLFLRESGAAGLADPVALSVRAKRELLDFSANKRKLKVIIQLARASLEIQAVNEPALVMTAVSDVQGSSMSFNNAALVVARKVGKRDVLGHIARIEDRARNNDVKGALIHYDLALKSSNEAKNLLFPVLSAALSEPEIIAGVGGYLEANASWGKDFITYLVAQKERYPALFDLGVLTGGLKAIDNNGDLLVSVNSLLFERKEYAKATTLMKLRSESLSQSMWGPSLNKLTLDPKNRPFAWQLLEGPDVMATRQNDQILISANNVRGGSAAQKIMFLEPGAYELMVGTRTLGSGKPILLNWGVSCLHGNNPWSPLDTSQPLPAARKMQIFELDIQPGCKPQLFTISVTPGDRNEGTEFLIESVRIGRRSL